MAANKTPYENTLPRQIAKDFNFRLYRVKSMMHQVYGITSIPCYWEFKDKVKLDTALIEQLYSLYNELYTKLNALESVLKESRDSLLKQAKLEAKSKSIVNINKG